MTGDSYLVQTGNQLSGYIIINDVSKNGKELVVQEQVTGTVNGAPVTITGTGACILKGRSDGAAWAEHRRAGYVWIGVALIREVIPINEHQERHRAFAPCLCVSVVCSYFDKLAARSTSDANSVTCGSFGSSSCTRRTSASTSLIWLSFAQYDFFRISAYSAMAAAR